MSEFTVKVELTQESLKAVEQLLKAYFAKPDNVSLKEVVTVVEEEKPFESLTVAVSRDHVKEVLAAKMQAGQSDAIKDIIGSYGVTKFSEIPDEHLATVLEKVEKL